jgi:transglutaminase-like putative cysteine protease
MKYLFAFLVVLLLTPWLGRNDSNTLQDTEQISPFEYLLASSLTNDQESSRGSNSPASETRKHTETNPNKESTFHFYVTPEDKLIKSLAAKISEPKDAYQIAVQWIYISDSKLNQTADKWLTPHEFLANTPRYPSNPLQGKEVSDCEEKANTLVSLIRAEGIQAEDIRVALGTIRYNNEVTGHAWVELFVGGHWMVLDPCSGPYWDDKDGELIQRQGVPFDYFAGHTFPIVQVWAYYNDIYYLDPRDSSGHTPASWCKGVLVQ